MRQGGGSDGLHRAAFTPPRSLELMFLDGSAGRPGLGHPGKGAVRGSLPDGRGIGGVSVLRVDACPPRRYCGERGGRRAGTPAALDAVAAWPGAVRRPAGIFGRRDSAGCRGESEHGVCCPRADSCSRSRCSRGRCSAFPLQSSHVFAHAWCRPPADFGCACPTQAFENNTNYVVLHAVWRILMYVCTFGLLISSRESGVGDGRRGGMEEAGLLANSKQI